MHGSMFGARHQVIPNCWLLFWSNKYLQIITNAWMYVWGTTSSHSKILTSVFINFVKLEYKRYPTILICTPLIPSYYYSQCIQRRRNSWGKKSCHSKILTLFFIKFFFLISHKDFIEVKERISPINIQMFLIFV